MGMLINRHRDRDDAEKKPAPADKPKSAEKKPAPADKPKSGK